jgi:hypothetical protein
MRDFTELNGVLYAGSSSEGVFMPTDSGATWVHKSNGIISPYIYSLYRSGSTLFAGTSSGYIYRSTNGGTQWTDVSAGLPKQGIYRMLASGSMFYVAFSYEHIWKRPLSDIVLDAGREPAAPGHFTLLQNYPNPFNPHTTFTFDIPLRTEVTLSLYDLLGREVAVVLKGVQDAGRHSINWEAGDSRQSLTLPVQANNPLGKRLHSSKSPTAQIDSHRHTRRSGMDVELAHIRTSVFHLILLLAGLLVASADLTAQSKFLYGMYAIGWGENEGITWNGSEFGMRTGTGGARLMTFWYDSLGMNTFFINTSNFPEGGEDNAPYVNFLYKNYAAHPTSGRTFIRESKIIPIYNCFQVTRAGETHYLKFSPATRLEGNIIDFDTSVFNVVPRDTFYIISTSAAVVSAPLIRDIAVRGGEYLQIRPRDWNTRRSSAFFKLRFRTYSLRGGPTLAVSLTNKASRTSRRNFQLVNDTITVAPGHNELVLPFDFDLKDDEGRYEAFVCRLGLKVIARRPGARSDRISAIR